MSISYRSQVLLLAALAPLATAAGDGFTRQFPISDCRFKPTGGNALFRLQVNRQLYLSNERCVDDGACDELAELWIKMLPATRTITFNHGGKSVTERARIMEEYETADGEVEEISRNYVADCNPMRDVYYFGEDVEDGDGNPLPDAWPAATAPGRAS